MTDDKAITLPNDYYTDRAKLGIELIGPEDLATPTLQLIQATSKVKDEDGRPYITGTWYHSLTKKTYKNPLVTFLVFQKQNLPSYSDKTVMERNYIYYGVMLPGQEPFKTYFRSSAIGVAKKFNSQIVASKSPMYSFAVELGSEFVQSDLGDYYKPVLNVQGKHTNPDLVVALEELTRQFSTEAVDEAELPYQISGKEEVVDPDKIPF